MLRKIVGLFVEHTQHELTELEGALARGDATAVSAFGHKLKGGAATVSADALCAAAAVLEGVSRSGSLAEMREQLERVREEFGRFAVDVEALLALEAAPATV